MVNIFGGDDHQAGSEGPRGPKGKQGERGKSATDLCTWLPDFILLEFRKIESCSYFFPKDGSGFSKSPKGVIEKLISHSPSPLVLSRPVDAVAVKPSQSTIEIPSKDRLAIQFNGSTLYKSEGVKLSDTGHAWVCLCVTFRVSAVYDQFIVSCGESSHVQFRGISATNRALRIWGVDDGGGRPFVHVPYPKGSWVTVMVEWSNIGKRVGSLNINNGQTIKTFTCRKLDATLDEPTWIGATKLGSQAMHGDLATLEIYVNESVDEPKLPDSLKQLIIRDQLITTKECDSSFVETTMEEGDVEPPVAKRRTFQPIK